MKFKNNKSLKKIIACTFILILSNLAWGMSPAEQAKKEYLEKAAAAAQPTLSGQKRTASSIAPEETGQPKTYKIEPQVILEATDGSQLQLPVSESAAKLSGTIKGIIDELGSEQPIPIPNTTGDDLRLLWSLLYLIETNPKFKNPLSLQEKIKLSDTILTQYLLPDNANLAFESKWLNLANYLDIPQLIDAFAIIIANNVTAAQWGSGTPDADPNIEKNKVRNWIVRDLRPLVAKYHWLFKKQDLPDVNFGFSIQELLDLGAIDFDTRVKADAHSNHIDLSNLRINDLTGLFDIPNIKKFRTIYLNNNILTNLQPGIFQELTNLKWLSLTNNQLTNLQPGAFSGLTNLKHLWLKNNLLSNLHHRAFQGTGRGTFVYLSGNPLTDQSKNELKEYFPNAIF